MPLIHIQLVVKRNTCCLLITVWHCDTNEIIKSDKVEIKNTTLIYILFVSLIIKYTRTIISVFILLTGSMLLYLVIRLSLEPVDKQHRGN